MPQPTPEQIRVLDSLVAHARPILRTQFRADSCIACTRVGLDVLDYFGIPAREYPLLVAIFNPAAVQLLNDGVPLAEIKAATQSFGPDEPGGPWTVGLGATPEHARRPDGWSGHLLIGSPDLGVVIDLSADQAARPHKNIHLEPYWAPVRTADWFMSQKARETLLTAEGVLLVLDRSAAPDPSGYLRSSNWWRQAAGETKVFRRLTGQIIRAMKADLTG